MTSSFLNSIGNKNSAIKRRILGWCINSGDFTIAELSKEMNISIPTVTKMVTELIDEGFLDELGKTDTSGGRRPNIYGLNASVGYFVGADLTKHHLSIAVSNFKGNILDYADNIPFTLEASVESISQLCELVKGYVEKFGIEKERVLAYGINLTGRVNHTTGYSFSFFLGEDKPIAAILEEGLEAPVFIENDSRAMAYGEYICGEGNKENHLIFINLSWGLGMGMIIDGKLLYGKSGFSGEIGHFPLLDNGIMCQCGKVGCLETGVSGSAVHRIFIEKLAEGKASVLSGKYARGEKITLDDILDAVDEEDMLAIESIEEIGNTLGRAIAGLINVFNPELVIIGGRMSVAEEYLMLPVRSAINKHSLNIVNRDTVVKFSKLGKKAGAYGACMLSRSHLLNIDV